MNVPGYRPQVQAEAPSSFRQQPVADANAFGAPIAQGLGKAADVSENIALKQKHMDDAKAVLDASNALSQDLINFTSIGDKALFATKGDNARGAANAMQDFIAKKATEYESKLTNQEQLYTFRQHIQPKLSAYAVDAANHERQQLDESQINTFNSGIELSKQEAGLNYANFPNLNINLADIDKNVDLKAIKLGWSQDVIKQQKKAEKSKAILGSFNSAMGANELKSAENIITTYGSLIDPAFKTHMQEAYRQRTDKIKNEQLAKAIVSSSKSLDEALSKSNQNGIKTGSVSWEQTKKLVHGNESGSYDNPYEAHNPDSGAHGKYQFMPGTWKEVMGDAPMTPENQELAFDKKYKAIYDKYGAEGVLVAVYAGDQNAERYAKGLPLIGDNGQEYSADAPQYSNGNRYPSVREYVQKALGSVTPTASDSLESEEANQKLRAQVLQEWSVQEQVKNLNNHAELERVKNTLAVLPPNATIQDRANVIQSSNLQPYVKQQLITAATTRTESDFGARAQLEKLAAYGKLNEQDVINLMPMLTQDHAMQYLQKAYASGSGKLDKESTAADKKWHAYIEAEGPYKGDAKKTQQLLVEITDRLNSEPGMTGYARFDRAMELIKQEADNKSANPITHYTINNNLERRGLVGAFGEKLVSLTEQGFKRNGRWKNSYYDINVFLSYIGKRIENGDTAAQETIDYLINGNYVINEDTFGRTYRTITGAQ